MFKEVTESEKEIFVQPKVWWFRPIGAVDSRNQFSLNRFNSLELRNSGRGNRAERGVSKAVIYQYIAQPQRLGVFIPRLQECHLDRQWRSGSPRRAPQSETRLLWSLYQENQEKSLVTNRSLFLRKARGLSFIGMLPSRATHIEVEEIWNGNAHKAILSLKRLWTNAIWLIWRNVSISYKTDWSFAQLSFLFTQTMTSTFCLIL